jgi:hypothetical protein
MYQKALEMEHFFLQGLHEGNLKVLSKGGFSQYGYWAGPVVEVFFCYV